MIFFLRAGSATAPAVARPCCRQGETRKRVRLPFRKGEPFGQRRTGRSDIAYAFPVPPRPTGASVAFAEPHSGRNRVRAQRHAALQQVGHGWLRLLRTPRAEGIPDHGNRCRRRLPPPPAARRGVRQDHDRGHAAAGQRPGHPQGTGPRNRRPPQGHGRGAGPEHPDPGGRFPQRRQDS